MFNLSKDYLIILFSLILMIAIAWGYLFLMAHEMKVDMGSMQMDMGSMQMDMGSMQTSDQFNMFAMPMDSQWGLNDFIVMSVMWIVMMFAMMAPSTFIFLFIFYSMRRNMSTVKNPKLELSILSFTYFLIWTGFSLFACFLQFILHNQGLVDFMGTMTNNYLAASTLILAGLFQFSNLKDQCLEKCRNPLPFIMGKKIEGIKEVVSIGFKHGLFCLGCCWALMLILFVNGVMNLLWIVILTFAILAEKIIPFHKLTSRFFGILLVLWGTFLIIF